MDAGVQNRFSRPVIFFQAWRLPARCKTAGYAALIGRPRRAHLSHTYQIAIGIMELLSQLAFVLFPITPSGVWTGQANSE
jgi:hypothetical protein